MRLRVGRIELIVVIFLIISLAANIYAQEKPIEKFLPDFYRVQFAGYTGLFTISAGKQLFNNRYSAGIGYGYTPYFIAHAEIHTVSIKQILYSRKKIDFKDNTITPSLALSVALETGNNSTLILPDKFPKNYYRTNSITFPLAIGLTCRHYTDNKKLKFVEFSIEGCTTANYLLLLVYSRNPANYTKLFSIALSLTAYY